MMRKKGPAVPPDTAALLRYVSGDSPLAEADWIRRWVAANPDREASIAELREAWERGAMPTAKWDGAALWSRIESEMVREDSRSPGQEPSDARERFSFAPHRYGGGSSLARRIIYAAAAALIVLAAGTAIVHSPQVRPSTTTIPAMREVTTAHGEPATLSLAAGSTVTQAPG